MTETVRAMGLGWSSVVWMAIKMALMMERDLDEPKEISWAHLKELQSEMWMAKQKVLLLVNRKDAQLEHVTEISLAQRMVILLVSSLVQLTDVDLEKLMEMRWAQPMEVNWDQMTDILKEMCLVELLAVMTVM